MAQHSVPTAQTLLPALRPAGGQAVAEGLYLASGCGRTDPTAIKWQEMKRLRLVFEVKRIPALCVGKMRRVPAEGAPEGPDWRWGAWADCGALLTVLETQCEHSCSLAFFSSYWEFRAVS